MGQQFEVLDDQGQIASSGTLTEAAGSASPWTHASRADWSAVTAKGNYRVKVGNLESPPWSVDPDAGDALLVRLLRIFQVNADGNEPNVVFGPAHLNDAAAPIVGGPTDGGTIDVSGGWRDAGDAIKFTTTIAMSSVLVDFAALLHPARSSELISTVGVGTRWLLKAHPTGSQTFIAQVGDNSDHNFGFRDFAGDDSSPNVALSRRRAYGDSGSGTLASGAAALALAAQRQDMAEPDTAELVAAAKEWYDRAKILAAPGPDIGGFSQPGGNDFSDWEGFAALAAAELYRVTAAESYLDDLLVFLAKARMDAGFSPYWTVGPLAAADVVGGLVRMAVPRADVVALAQEKLVQATDASLARAGTNAFGTPGGFWFGWVQDHTGNAAIGAAAVRAGVGSVPVGFDAQARDYVLGRNPWGASFLVGPAGHEAHDPHHAAFVMGDPTQLLSGAAVGGPVNLGQLNDFVDITPNPNDRFAPWNPTDPQLGQILYEDQRPDFVTSEVGLSYSAPALLLVAGIAG